MSIRSKFILVILGLFLAYLLAAQAIQCFVVMPSFTRLQREDSSDNFRRARDAVLAELQHIATQTRDWSIWDDTYQWMEDRNEKYTNSNLVPVEEKLANAGFNALVYCDAQGKIIWSGACDIETKQVIELPEVVAKVKSLESRLAELKDPEAAITGVVMTRQGPILLATAPILPGDRKGQSRGTLTMGHLLTPTVVAALAKQTATEAQIWPLKDKPVPSELREVFDKVFAADSPQIDDSVAGKQRVYGGVRDMSGAPALLIRVEQPRSITAQGERQARMAFFTAAVAGAVILGLLWVVLNTVVIAPLSRMTRHTKAVGASSDLSARLNLTRRDELGALAAEFDRMVASLADSRRKMLDAAHKSGMADIATDVLHNVGNALNTVNVSAQTLSERIEKTQVNGLVKAAAMLNEHRQDLPAFFSGDPRGGKLVDFLTQLSDHLSRQQTGLLDEVGGLRQQVDHIKDIISAQQSLAKAPRFVQEEDLRALIRDVLRMQAAAMAQRNIAVEFQCPELPPIPLSKSKLMQVLTNVMQNAADAMNEPGVKERRLCVRARVEGEQVVIEVADTGHGVAPENLANIFQSGFTTKTDGHGFGLHYCANAMTEMGGRIDVASDGPGKGATFTLRLPMVAAGVPS